MNFVTSVFKKYINKNEIKQQVTERPTNNADQLFPTKKSDAEKHPAVTSNSSTTGGIIDTNRTEEDETFQDAVTGSDSLTDHEEPRKTEQTFLPSAEISGQSSVDRSSTAQNPDTSPSRTPINKMQDPKTEISQEKLSIPQRDSITFNITEPDSLNASMVDSLEAPNGDGLLPNHELSDSLEVLEYESSRESSTEPATFNAEDSIDYVSLSYILNDSIENSSSANTILESSLNVKRSPLEMSGISLPNRSNSNKELTTSRSEGALENLIRSVNETLVPSENAHRANIDDPKEFNNVANLNDMETDFKLENTEQKESVDEFQAKEKIPLKSTTAIKNAAAERNSDESELQKSAEEMSKTFTKESLESELKPYTNDIKLRKESAERPNIGAKDANSSLEDLKCLSEPKASENVCHVEKTELEKKLPQFEGAVLSTEEKQEKVEAKTPAKISEEERIRIYERQETQELDQIIKKLATDNKSSPNEDNRISFERQDTQEFEKLERNFEENQVSFHRQDTEEFENLEKKFEGIAKSSTFNTDDILDILVANSQNPHVQNGKPSDEEQRSEKTEIVDLNNHLVEGNENHEKSQTSIEYQRQDTQEFENLERQYANDVLEQLVLKSDKDSANKELSKNAESSHRSEFLFSMIEHTNMKKPAEEINCTENKSNEPIGKQKAKNNEDQTRNKSEARVNQVANSSLNDQIKEAKPAEEINVLPEQSETSIAAKNKTIQSSKSELEAQNKNATTNTEHSAKIEENPAAENGRDGSVYELKTATYKSQKSTNKKYAQRKKNAKQHFSNSSAPDGNDAQAINSRVNDQNKLEENIEAELKPPVLESSEDQMNGNKGETLNLNENHAEENTLTSTQNKSATNNGTRNGIGFDKDFIKPANKNRLKIENSTNEINSYKKLLEQYEKRIFEQNTELEKLKTELSSNFRHFNNTEMAFSDLFEKYEKAKSVITLYKQNEDILVENIENAEGQLMQLESKCTAMKRQSLEQIRRAQQETEDEKQRYRRDLSNLHAQVKRLEIKAASLEVELIQKTEECQALANLCDEITGRH